MCFRLLACVRKISTIVVVVLSLAPISVLALEMGAPWTVNGISGPHPTLRDAENSMHQFFWNMNSEPPNKVYPGEKFDYRGDRVLPGYITVIGRHYVVNFNKEGQFYDGPTPTGSAANCQSWPVPSWNDGLAWYDRQVTGSVLGTDCWYYGLSRYFRHVVSANIVGTPSKPPAKPSAVAATTLNPSPAKSSSAARAILPLATSTWPNRIIRAATACPRTRGISTATSSRIHRSGMAGLPPCTSGWKLTAHRWSSAAVTATAVSTT